MKLIPCPLCSHTAFSVVAGRSRRGTAYQCVRCASCGFHFVNPEPAPDELAAFYGAEYSEQHDEVWHGLEDDANRVVIAKLLSCGVRSLIDLGAGQGRFVSMARAAGIDTEGIEQAPANVAEAKRRYGVVLSEQTVAQFLDGEPRNIECVTLLNVFEHLPDPVGVLTMLRSTIRPGGTLLVIVPNTDFTLTLGAFRRAIGFRDVFMMESPWFSQQGFDPPVHLSSFTARHLAAALSKSGFRPLNIEHAPVIRTRSLVMNAAKKAVAATGRLLEIATAGRVHWGYSLLVVAVRD